MTEQPADQGQVLARHDRLAGGGMAQVVQAEPAESGVFADRAPALGEAVGAAAFGEAREQEGVAPVGSGRRGDVLACGFAERDRARARR